MFEQVEKPKENKSRAVANSVTQKKSDVKQGFGFVDNRSEAKQVTQLHGTTYHFPQEYNLIQQKHGQLRPIIERKEDVMNDFICAEAASVDTTHAPSSENIIQRSVGLEIESSPSWQAYSQDYTAITGQHFLLYSTPQFRL